MLQQDSEAPESVLTDNLCEYIRMYNFFNETYDKPQSPYDMTPLVVITGQPGIG